MRIWYFRKSPKPKFIKIDKNTGTYSVHIDDIFYQKISLERMNTSSINHHFKSACWTGKFTAKTDDTATAVVAFFGTATT